MEEAVASCGWERRNFGRSEGLQDAGGGDVKLVKGEELARALREPSVSRK